MTKLILIPEVTVETNQVVSEAETHAAGFLWAMIILRRHFQEPLHSIAEKAAWQTCIGFPVLGQDGMPVGIGVAPPCGSSSSNFEEEGQAVRLVRMLLSEMNAALAEGTEIHYGGAAKEDSSLPARRQPCPV